jgi:AcrR family transcriptional regulator
MAEAPNMRERILSAALELLRSGGLKKFGQTQIAKAAGIPQGHLTYYFPKKADLVVAVARRSIDLLAGAVGASPGMAASDPAARERIIPLITSIIQDRERTRMLLGMLIEADDNEEVRTLQIANSEASRKVVAEAVGLDPAKPEATALIAFLWGLGVYHFMYRDSPSPSVEEVLRAMNAFAKLAGQPEPLKS